MKKLKRSIHKHLIDLAYESYYIHISDKGFKRKFAGLKSKFFLLIANLINPRLVPQSFNSLEERYILDEDY